MRDACPKTEPRGWGTACETLTLHKDNYYHCGDCGLMYVQNLKRYRKMEKTAPTAQCQCAILKETTEWWFDECNGHECPRPLYFCSACGRHYEVPALAAFDQQKSQAGKNEVSRWIEFERREHEQRITSLKEDIVELKRAMKDLSLKDRRTLLRPLWKLIP